MIFTRNLLSVLACVAVLSLAGVVGAQDKRIGFAEEFDSATGWSGADKFKSITAAVGIGIWETYIGSIDGSKPEDQPMALSATNKCGKVYDGEVDLDKYHYIVMKTAERSGLVELDLNGKNTHVAYTSGVVAQDIKPLGLGGKAKITLMLKIMNTGRPLKVDYIRLVSELTDEEKAGLIATPISLYKENIQALPYQGLEALWIRAARPVVSPIPEEKTLFHDTATGMPIWRMTALTSYEGIKGADQPFVWWPDGSLLTTPSRSYDYATDKYSSKKVFKEPYSVIKTKDKVSFIQNAADGPKVLTEIDVPKCLAVETAAAGRRMVAAFIGTELVVVDAPAKDGDKPVIKRIPLPPTSCKGSSIRSDGKVFSYNSPWGSYHRIDVMLDEGKVTPGPMHTMTHGMHGEDWSIMTYTENAKVILSPAAQFGDSATPGKEITLLAVYNGQVATDYGDMTTDYRYGITNGLGGELSDQYLLIDRLDGGTFLRVCTYNTSFATWGLRAKAMQSPDSTKLAYASDIFGAANFYVATMRLPNAPTDAKTEPTDKGPKITWKAPALHAEIKGYNVYGSVDSGKGFVRLNKELVKGLEFVDESLGKVEGMQARFYLVAAEENSGMMSLFSNLCGAGVNNRPVVLHYQAEAGELVKPMRLVIDGLADGYYAVRLTKVSPTETTGQFTLNPAISKKADYQVWVRARMFRKGANGTLTLGTKTDAALTLAKLPLDDSAWKWIKTPKPVVIETGDKLTFSSDDDGVMVDKIIITDDAAYLPATANDRTAPPPAPKDLKVAKSDTNSVELSWSPVADPDLLCYSVYVGDKADFTPGNASIICSTRKTTASDWGIKPGSNYHYKVVAVDKRGKESPAVAVEAKTSPLTANVIQLPLKDATLGEGLTKGTSGQNDYAECAAGAKPAKADLTFDSPADGMYYFWIQFTGPVTEEASGMEVLLDGKNLGQMSVPITKMQDRWYVVRMEAKVRYGKTGPVDSARLAAGKHTLTLDFQKPGKTPKICKVWVTNDASFVPAGYNPQSMYKTKAKAATAAAPDDNAREPEPK